jgi:very-short-patch-repair endonuclease
MTENKLNSPTQGCMSIPDYIEHVAQHTPASTIRREICCRCKEYKPVGRAKMSRNRYNLWLYVCVECNTRIDYVHRNPNRLKESPEETTVRLALEEARVEPCKQEYCPIPGVHWRFDFYFPRLKLAVEIDSSKHGGFRKRRDHSKDNWAASKGIVVERIPCHQPEIGTYALSRVRARVDSLGQDSHASVPVRSAKRPSVEEPEDDIEDSLPDRFRGRWSFQFMRIFKTDYVFTEAEHTVVETFFALYPNCSLAKLFKTILRAWKYSARLGKVIAAPLAVCEGSQSCAWTLTRLEAICRAFRLTPENTLGPKRSTLQSQPAAMTKNAVARQGAMLSKSPLKPNLHTPQTPVTTTTPTPPQPGQNSLDLKPPTSAMAPRLLAKSPRQKAREMAENAKAIAHRHLNL